MKGTGRHCWIFVVAAMIGNAAMTVPAYAPPQWYVYGECVAIDISPISKYAADLRAGRVGPQGLPFNSIVDYVEAAAVRDHPNRMARDQFDRNSYPYMDDDAADAEIERIIKLDDACGLAGAEAEFAKIKRIVSDDLWRGLEFMAYQDQDDDCILYAAEIAVRLDPERFERMANSAAVRSHPTNDRLFKLVRWDWLHQDVP